MTETTRRNFFATLLAPLAVKALPPAMHIGVDKAAGVDHTVINMSYVTARYFTRMACSPSPDDGLVYSEWLAGEVDRVGVEMALRLRHEQEKFVTRLFSSNALQNH